MPGTGMVGEEDSSTRTWRDHWYPIVFERDLRIDEPYAFTLFGEPLVLFRGADQRWFCGPDRCPHRAARLSEGRLRGGSIECLYHGWQFAADGRCVAIPQWPGDRPLPAAACLERYALELRQGLFWVWPGRQGDADPSRIPIVPALDAPDVYVVDYLTDLPYGQSFLVENVIDVAHIHVAHDGIRGGGHRELAAPLEFDVTHNSARGIAATFRSVPSTAGGGNSDAPAGTARVEFVAPNLVWYTSDYDDPGRIAGLALYSLPLDIDRCRLLYRKYSNFYAPRERSLPRWREHRVQNEILRQDMSLIIGQHDAIRRAPGELRDLWLPLKTSDALVLAYRKWLDRYAADRPDHRGLTSHRELPPPAEMADVRDVYSMHTRHCHDCRQMHERALRVRRGLLAAMVLAVPTMVMGGSALRLIGLVGYFAAALGVHAATRLRRSLERGQPQTSTS